MRIFAFLLFSVFWIQCKKSPSELKEKSDSNVLLEYANTFAIQEKDSLITIQFKTPQKSVQILKKDLPIQECMVMNASTVGYLEALNALSIIKGVASANYIYNPKIHHELENGTISTVGTDINWDIEKIIQSGVKYIFCIYQPNMQHIYDQLNQQGVKILYIDEYLESQPLGRTEYIKLFGLLLCRQEFANTTFQNIKENYINTQEKSKNMSLHPKIVSKIMYGDIWFMPEGNSYSALLYKDAGAEYPWANTTGSGSLSLNFEEVYTETKDAQLWVDVSDIQQANQLLALNNGYSHFEAFQNHQLYALTGRKRGLANDFYESGVVYADKVIHELNYIFRNFENINKDSLFYYQKIIH